MTLHMMLFYDTLPRIFVRFTLSLDIVRESTTFITMNFISLLRLGQFVTLYMYIVVNACLAQKYPGDNQLNIETGYRIEAPCKGAKEFHWFCEAFMKLKLLTSPSYTKMSKIHQLLGILSLAIRRDSDRFPGPLLLPSKSSSPRISKSLMLRILMQKTYISTTQILKQYFAIKPKLRNSFLHHCGYLYCPVTTCPLRGLLILYIIHYTGGPGRSPTLIKLS